MKTETVSFKTNELSRNGQAILEAARSGPVILQDDHGRNLVLLPQTQLGALEALVTCVVNLLAVERTLAEPASTRSGEADYGEWDWLRVFDDEDLSEFVSEAREALLAVFREASTLPIDKTIERWRITAGVLADPVRREVLLGTHSEEDFIEIEPPK